MDLRPRCGLDYLLLGRPGPGQQQVIADRRVEQVGVLRDNGHQRAGGFLIVLPQLPAVQQDMTFPVLPETQQQMGQGRLAGAARSDQGYEPVLRQVETDAIQGRRLVRRVRKAQVLHSKGNLRRPARRVGRIDGGRIGVYDLKESPACFQAASQVLESPGQGQHRLETRQYDQDQHGQVHAVQFRGAHQGNRDGQHGQGSQVHEQPAQGALQPPDAGHPCLQTRQIEAQPLYAAQVASLCAESQQIGHPLDAVHQQAVQLCADADQVQPGAPRQSLCQQRQGGAGQQQRHQQGEGQPGIKGAHQENHQQSHQQGHNGWGQHAQVEILQGLDVGHDARQQVSTPVLHQACRGQWLQRAVEPDPEAGQQAKGDLVRYQALQVAKAATGDAKETNADDGDLKVGNRGAQSCPGDQVPRGAHQADAASDGRKAKDRSQYHPPGKGSSQFEQAPEHPPLTGLRGQRFRRNGTSHRRTRARTHVPAPPP